MHPYQAYRRHSQFAWTRVDMLLTIYDAAIATLDSGIQVLQEQDLKMDPAIQLRASQLLLLLLDGIDVESSDVAARIRDLCLFCVSQIGSPTAASWTSARDVLCTLREGFQAIREEAIHLESAGVIPQLPQTGPQTLLHV